MVRRNVQMAKVVGLCMAAAVFYGVVHDQITARVCVEYFTIAHPPIFGTTSPTVLGICWGIAATIGVGALLGMVLAVVSQSRGSPPVPVSALAPSMVMLLAVMAVSAALAGALGFELSRRGVVHVPASLAELVPAERHDRFMAVWFAHGASYAAGLLGGAFIILRIWLARGRPAVLAIFPRTRGAAIRALLIAAIAAAILWFRFARS